MSLSTSILNQLLLYEELPDIFFFWLDGLDKKSFLSKIEFKFSRTNVSFIFILLYDLFPLKCHVWFSSNMFIFHTTFIVILYLYLYLSQVCKIIKSTAFINRGYLAYVLVGSPIVITWLSYRSRSSNLKLTIEIV